MFRFLFASHRGTDPLCGVCDTDRRRPASPHKGGGRRLPKQESTPAFRQSRGATRGGVLVSSAMLLPNYDASYHHSENRKRVLSRTAEK